MKQVFVLSMVLVVILLLLGMSTGLLDVNVNTGLLPQYWTALLQCCLGLVGGEILRHLLKRGPGT